MNNWLRFLRGAAFVAGGAALFVWGQGLLKRPRVNRERRKQDTGNPTGKAPLRTPEPGDILLFFRPNKIGDHIIEWVTGSRFFHAALYAGEESMIEARPSGVVYAGLAGRGSEYVVLPAPEGKGEEALVWAQTQIGAPYDPTDILVIGLEQIFKTWHINYTGPGRYTCAELVVEAYRSAGVDLVPGRDASAAVPSEIALLLPD